MGAAGRGCSPGTGLFGQLFGRILAMLQVLDEETVGNPYKGFLTVELNHPSPQQVQEQRRSTDLGEAGKQRGATG